MKPRGRIRGAPEFQSSREPPIEWVFGVTFHPAMRPGAVSAVVVHLSRLVLATGLSIGGMRMSALGHVYDPEGSHVRSAGRIHGGAVNAHLRGPRFVQAYEGPAIAKPDSLSRTNNSVTSSLPDAGGTLSLMSLSLAALAGIAWVRCRTEPGRR